MFANTPPPPYYAVMFTSMRRGEDPGYETMARAMAGRASVQPGFLGMESCRDVQGVGITLSYWKDLESIAAWRADAHHQVARSRGRQEWYSGFRLRVALVEREEGMDPSPGNNPPA